MNNSTNSNHRPTNKELELAFTGETQNVTKKRQSDSKKWILFLTLGIIGILSGTCCIIYAVLNPPVESLEAMFPNIPTKSDEVEFYSALTGEKLASAAERDAPVYCIQTPNGTDGARPQAGLDQAGVIFEAIAEAGITRFAAIYQNPTSAVIGPIRSLRIYYLEWDTPFDCTIVHAGGADDALVAVASGGYRDLSEDYKYMYRSTAGARLWNNLFTTSTYLKQYNDDHSYTTSNVDGFARMSPAESERARVDELAVEKLDITKPASMDTSALTAKVDQIGLKFGGWASFNVNYTYDMTTNKYLRSYETGEAHTVYSCPEGDLGEKSPESVCELTQMAPSVVIAMVVQEQKASDGYHEDIDAVGTGKAYIFQNGTVITGKWNKASKDMQIKFIADDGNEIKLATGQTIISAVPNYGRIEY